MSIALPTRDGLIRAYERDYQNRRPSTPGGDNTLLGIEARCAVDMVLPLFAEALRLGDLPSLDGLTSAQLEQEAADRGLPRRLDAAGASGFVSVVTASGGATVASGATLTNPLTSQRYQCLDGGTFVTGDHVPITGIDTGPGTNVAPGVVLAWDSPAAGLSPSATVVGQGDGTGITGGRDAETDDGIKQRIYAAYADPAAAGNDADVRAEALKTPGLSIEAVFTYPAILGPGSTCVVFTMRPSAPGASRIPNGAQIEQVTGQLYAKFPADDSIFVGTIVAVPTTVILRVRWSRGAAGWVDPTPWPVYDAAHFVVDASPAPSATTFTISTAMASPPAPQAGQTIGFWDAANGKWRRKRILSVTGTGPWAIIVDTALAVSDTTFTPAHGDSPCPWSDSLDAVAPIVIAEFDSLGPGEQVMTPFDLGGLRQRRNPPAKGIAWSDELTGRIYTPLFALTAIEEARVVEPDLPYEVGNGGAGVFSRMLTLKAPLVYPL